MPDSRGMAHNAKSVIHFSLNIYISRTFLSGKDSKRVINGLTGMALEGFIGSDVPDLMIAFFDCTISCEFRGLFIFKALYILPKDADVYLSKD